jgi:hypothetical protein
VGGHLLSSRSFVEPRRHSVPQIGTIRHAG